MVTVITLQRRYAIRVHANKETKEITQIGIHKDIYDEVFHQPLNPVTT